MPIVVVPAADWPIQIGAVDIGGLITLSFKRSKTDADVTTRDSAGNAESFVAERARSIDLEGKFLEDPDTGDRDPGQAAVEALGELIGLASRSAFTLTSPGGTVYSFQASANIPETIGGMNEGSNWKAELTVSGVVSIT